MLPPRIPKKAKRSTRWRSQAHCNFVRSHGCSIPGCGGRPIEVAHVRRGAGAGVGQKPDDWNTISLCRAHHAEQHRIGEQSFERLHGFDMREIADLFAAESPRRSQICGEQRSRGHD